MLQECSEQSMITVVTIIMMKKEILIYFPFCLWLMSYKLYPSFSFSQIMLPCSRWLRAKAMKRIRQKGTKKSSLMTGKSVERHYSMLMSFTKLELTQVNSRGGRLTVLHFSKHNLSLTFNISRRLNYSFEELSPSMENRRLD